MTDSQLNDLPSRVRTLQIIVGALASGVATFAVVAFLLRQDAKPLEPGTTPVISYMALGVAAVQIPLAVLVPKLVADASRRRIARHEPTVQRSGEIRQETGDTTPDPSDALATIFSTKTIIGGAILEGTAFLLLFSYVREGQLVCLGTGIAAACGLAALFPTEPRVRHWIETQLLELNRE